MHPPNSSLVKYDTPILINSTKDSRGKGKSAKRAAASAAASAVSAPKQTTPTEDILNSILPPREWTQDGQLWVQYVSSTPATASDLLTLQEQLDQKLQHRQARETGICPIREELYAQCFDELIRQMTINCAERGLLLLRVRDELRMSIASYQTLYESSIAFGMRKALTAEQHKADMEAKVRQMEQEVQDLEQAVGETKQRRELAELKEQERESGDSDRHQDEIQALKEHNDALRAELERILSLPAKNTATVATLQ